MSDDQSLDPFTEADAGISVSEGAQQLVSERAVEPAEQPPEILDYRDGSGGPDQGHQSVSARDAAEGVGRNMGDARRSFRDDNSR
jgi:hypothetical protein